MQYSIYHCEAWTIIFAASWASSAKIPSETQDIMGLRVESLTELFFMETIGRISKIFLKQSTDAYGVITTEWAI